MDHGFVLRLALAACYCLAVSAQTSDGALKFEVASVKPAERPVSGGITMSVNNDPGRITLTNTSSTDIGTRPIDTVSARA